MRQFLLGLSISIAFILGCLTAQQLPGTAVSPASASTDTTGPAASGQRWQYKCVNGPDRSTLRTYYENLPATLNEQGADGWEYMTFLANPDYLCFKRPG